MATVADVAKRSLSRILVQGSEAPLEADEYQSFIMDLNNYMTSLEAEGVNLGYTIVYNLADEVTVPMGALAGIIDNMAVRVAPDYGATASQELIQNAVNGMKAMRMLGQKIPRGHYPGTLPRGSGNYSEYSDVTFYRERDTKQCP
jgi:hypothetical protein